MKRNILKTLKQSDGFYNLEPILKLNATYMMIIGERSNGKTYATLKHMLKEYVEHKFQGAVIRRWELDIRGRYASTYFDNLVSTGVVKKLTKGKWDRVLYNSGRWYLAKFEDNKMIHDETPFCFAFALSQTEHAKSTSYPDVWNIVFDEFLTRGRGLEDEFVLFMNTISTIVRHRRGVKIFMLANTVNKSSTYFSEMGLTNIKNQKQGTIELYEYGESGLTVAVEYCHPAAKDGKPSDVYFAFDNPKLKMITGGAWEMAMYPHLTPEMKYKFSDIIFEFFIIWEDDILHCEVVEKDDERFIFIHEKTTPIKKENEDLIYTTEVKSANNYNQKITQPRNGTERKILQMFKENRVFYQSNEIGEIVRNYLQWCQESRM